MEGRMRGVHIAILLVLSLFFIHADASKKFIAKRVFEGTKEKESLTYLTHQLSRLTIHEGGSSGGSKSQDTYDHREGCNRVILSKERQGKFKNVQKRTPDKENISEERRYNHKKVQKYNFDRRKDRSVLSIVSFNTKWLVVPSVASTQSLRSIRTNGLPSNIPPECPWKDYSEAKEHMMMVAKRMNDVQAHIFVLSEVQNMKALEELRSLLIDGGKYESFLIPGTDGKLKMNVGILSQISPLKPPKRLIKMVPLISQQLTGEKGGNRVGVAKNIVAEFMVRGKSGPAFKMALIGAHLRSNTFCEKARKVRAAQASIIADAVNSFTAEGYKIVVAGDLNDFDRQVRGKLDHLTTSTTLDIIKESGRGLINPLNVVPFQQRFSTDRETLLDYVLVNSTLPIFSAEIYNQQHMSIISEGYDEKKLESDHYPIKVEIDLQQFVASPPSSSLN